MEEGNSGSPYCLPRTLMALERAGMGEGAVTTPVCLLRARPWEARYQRGLTASLTW